MKSALLISVFIIFFLFSLHGEDDFPHFFVLSSGYSILHDFENGNHSGFNITLNYEPGLIENVNVDIALLLNIYKKKDDSKPLFRNNYDLCHSPSISLGPKYYLPFFEKFKPFAGSGIHLTVSINRNPVNNETDLSFSPGVYVKTGFDYFFGRKFFTGFETYYKWCFTDMPYAVSFKIRLGYIY